MSVKQVTKLANKIDFLMFLCLLRPKKLPKEKKKKTKAKASAAKGLTEGEKRRVMKETGPAKLTYRLVNKSTRLYNRLIQQSKGN